LRFSRLRAHSSKSLWHYPQEHGIRLFELRTVFVLSRLEMQWTVHLWCLSHAANYGLAVCFRNVGV
jgi:hypothetical protein